MLEGKEGVLTEQYWDVDEEECEIDEVALAGEDACWVCHFAFSPQFSFGSLVVLAGRWRRMSVPGSVSLCFTQESLVGLGL